MSRDRRLRASLRRHGLWRRPGDLRRALGRQGLRFTEGNAVDVYDCGEAAFPVMLEAIEGASETVHVETYTLRNDTIGGHFIEALVHCASRGVDVRLMYDALGSLDLDPRALDPLIAEGGDVLDFNPVRRFYPRWAPRRRDHRKLLVVDGCVAFTGGLNIGDEYDAPAIGSASRPGWRDTHVRLRGPVVRDLSAVFLESWFRADGAELHWHSLLDAQPGAPGSSRCGVVPDGPVYRRRAMRDLLVSALDDARRTARLTSAYFAPDRHVLEALGAAAERGVQVELLLAGNTDHPWMRRGARSTIERLLRRGLRVHEYSAAMLHAKTAVFDGRFAVVGSSNLDRQSLQHNFEVNVVFAGHDVPGQIDELFEADLAHSEEITLERLANRGLFTRAFDRIAAAAIHAFV